MSLRRMMLPLIAALLLAGGAAAEVRVRMPEKAKVGEIVDVEVSAEEGAESVTYTLKNGRDTVFSGKEDTHFVSAFRPRGEGEYTLSVMVAYADGSREEGGASVSVSGRAEEIDDETVIYSQKDGWWKDKKYSKTDLDNGGCAIFTLSHAVHRMGFSGESVRPEALAKTHANCYTKNGTANARLIYNAAEIYGYTTKKNLLNQKTDLREALKNGDYFSFSIVLGHIALMTGINEKGDKVRIVDSAPSATFERIKKGKIYYLKDGEYVEAADPGEIPGARYYFETRYYGGLEYWMDLEYCARRGGRLIRPAWVFYEGKDGRIGVQMTEISSGESTIVLNGEEMTVPTRELSFAGGGEGTKLAVVNKKTNIKMLNADGKRIGTIAPRTILPVLRTEEKRALVVSDDLRGYVNLSDVEIIEPIAGEIRTGALAVNGNTSGRATVKLRYGPSAKEKIVDNWKTGTPVTLIRQEGDFWLVEGKGKRVWVQEDYLKGDIPEKET